MNYELAALVLGIHIAAAAVWVGGVVSLGVLSVAVRAFKGLDEGFRSRLIVHLAQRLSWVIWPALLVAILTGLYNLTWYLPGGLSSLPSSSDLYLMAKAGLVGLVVVLSAFHTLAVSPAIRRGVVSGMDPARLRRARALNGILGAVILMASLIILFLAAALQFY